MATIPVAPPPVSGLPVGLQFAGSFLPAGEDDFELLDGHIYKGKRAGAAAAVRVIPAEGYEFVRLRGRKVQVSGLVGFDPRDEYVAAKIIPAETIELSAKFHVTNEMDKKTVESAIEQVVKNLPGYSQ